MKTVTGPFHVTMHAEPPYAERDGVVLARARFDKRFEGALDAMGEVQMLAVTTPDPKARAYVALERITGSLDGGSGSFVVTHVAAMTPGPSLAIAIVPGTGTGALVGITGAMRIRIEPGGAHFYELDYAL
jgi:hypothetical protein